jgi:signal peptidase I
MTSLRRRGATIGLWLWEWTKAIAVALLVWSVFRTFLIEAFRIPSGSMERTMLIGDWLFVNKLLYGAEVPFIERTLPALREPVHGDIVVFDSVEDEEQKVVKRLIGLPGDTLAMRAGIVYRNGAALDEPYVVHEEPVRSETRYVRLRMREWQLPHYIGPDPRTYLPDLEEWGPIVVPPDSLFVMGDNRQGSYDSRYWGFLPRANVRGRPMFVYFSYDAKGYESGPVFDAVRWERIFKALR